ncbi:hypothetical protein [Rhodococcus sp. NPDC127528]|uniref:hypothetical protein n=1 Tax=unclassified Rhodococcus (in: high G+C Gram-positive bacteria) TaxID=192944 RepID=UPI0036293720
MAEATIDEATMSVIHLRAVELADQAPPLTAEQVVRLRTVFGSRRGKTGAAAHV